MDRTELKKFRLFQISLTDNLMKKDKTWNSLSLKQKWKSIYRFTKKLEKISFNKNGILIRRKK